MLTETTEVRHARETHDDDGGTASIKSREDGEVLRVSGIVKRFGATMALRGVDFTLRSGEILALVGANGAGKSTLTSILSGAIEPTEGRIEIEGRPVHFKSILDASRAGIETIVQSFDEALLGTQTVAENLAFPALVQHRLGAFPSEKALIDNAKTVAQGLIDVPLDRRLDTLDASQRQWVLITRALATHPRILILDEPTASLDIGESKRLHSRIQELARTGTAVIYISHHMREVSGLCDRAIVLRDGTKAGEFSAPLDIAQMVRAMLGRSITDPPDIARPAPRHQADSPHAAEIARRRVVLALRGIQAFPDSAPIDVSVHEGEVLGLTGLIGAGKTEVLAQIVGVKPLLHGAIDWQGAPFRPAHSGDAIAAGIGYVPEDRQSDAEIPWWSVEDNIVFPDLGSYRTRLGLIDSRKIRIRSESILHALNIVGFPTSRIEALSGGNRQKVMIGRWFAARSKLLIMDEPFRGVDIGARADIAALLRQSGTAMVASSDPDEILQVADRIIILSHGAISGEVNARDVTSEQLSELIATGA